MVDKRQAEGLIVSAVVGALMALAMLIKIIFKEPPPKRLEVLRAVAEKVLAIGSGMAATWISAPWAADLLNALIGLWPLKLGIKVDPVTAASLVTGLTVLMICSPEARARLIPFLRAKIRGLAQ